MSLEVSEITKSFTQENPLPLSRFALIYPRQNPGRHYFRISVPIRSILGPALSLVPAVAMDQQHREIHHVKVRDGGAKAGGQTPRPRHDPIPKVIDVSRDTPPSGDQEFATTLSLQILKMLKIRVVRVGAELVLLAIRAAEDPIPEALNGENARNTDEPKVDGVHGEISALQGVHERDPTQIAEAEHEAEAVGGDVHGGENRRLVDETVDRVPGLEYVDQDHAVGYATEARPLMR
jgi:hypothetical protein